MDRLTVAPQVTNKRKELEISSWGCKALRSAYPALEKSALQGSPVLGSTKVHLCRGDESS